MRRLGEPEDIANGVLLLRLRGVLVGHRPDALDRRRPCDLLTRTRPCRLSTSRRCASCVAIPSVSRDAAAGDHARAPPTGWPRGSRSRGGRVEETDGHPGRARRVARRAGRADGAGLRPLRRAADRRPRRVDDAAVRADRRDGDVLRGRGVTDDKGPVLAGRSTLARAFLAAGRRGCRSTSGSCSRARRRSAARTCRPTCASTPTSSPPTWSSPPTARCGGRPSRRCRSPPRGWSALDVVVTGADRDLHSGPLRRHGRQPAARPGAASLAALHDAGRRGRRPRLLRRHRRRSPARRGPRSPRSASTRRPTAPSSASPSCTASRATPRWNGSGSGPPSRSTASRPAASTR